MASIITKGMAGKIIASMARGDAYCYDPQMDAWFQVARNLNEANVVFKASSALVGTASHGLRTMSMTTLEHLEVCIFRAGHCDSSVVALVSWISEYRDRQLMPPYATS